MQASSLDRGPQHQPSEQLPAEAGTIGGRSTHAALSALVTLYALGLALLYAIGQFGFFWKTVVTPALFIVAYFARRFSAFVRDWAVFLAAVVLFDNLRGLIYAVTLHFQRPMYMGYAIELERTLFSAPIPSSRLQQALTTPAHIGVFERSLVVVHASHFLAFLLFGLLLWITRPQVFARYKLAMVLVMGLGMLGYSLVPTVPPWMAASRFHVLEPVRHIPAQIYGLAAPKLAESFDLNPVAAMPSLHAAFPTMLALVSFEAFGAWGLLMAAYALTACFAIVFLGEHYVVDVMVGNTLAFASFLLVFRTPLFARWLGPRAPIEHEGPLWRRALRLRRPLALAVLLLVLAQASEISARALQGRADPTDDFVARELDGKSPVANYYHGLNAYCAGDFAHARRFFDRAAREVPDADERSRAHQLLGECAFHAGDARTVVRELGMRSNLSAEQALMLAEAHLQLGQRDLGFALLDFAARTYPGDSSVQAQRARLERRYARAR